MNLYTDIAGRFETFFLNFLHERRAVELKKQCRLVSVPAGFIKSLKNEGVFVGIHGAVKIDPVSGISIASAMAGVEMRVVAK